MSPTQKVATPKKKIALSKDFVRGKKAALQKHKKSKQSKNSANIASQTKASLSSKFDVLQALQRKNTSTTSTPAKVLKPMVLTSILPTLAISVLSPYRFPIDTHKVAVGIARYGGVFFVLVGAFCVLSLMSVLSKSHAPQLATVSVSTSTHLQTPSVDCSDPLQYLSVSCGSVVDQTPEAQFEVNNGTQELHDTVRVQVIVPFATKVALSVYSQSLHRNQYLGLMTHVVGNTWEFHVNTKEITDGSYILTALVTNGYGTYEQKASSPVTVVNYPLVSTSIATNTQNAATTDLVGTDIPQQTTPDVLLKANTTSAQSEFRFAIEASVADAVKLYAVKEETGKTTLLGNAYKSSDTTWRYRWVLTSVENGVYKITAQVISDGSAKISNPVTVTKIASVVAESLDQQLAATTSPQVVVAAPLTPAPSADIDIQANLPLLGTIGLKIDVTDAESVEIYSQNKTGLLKKLLGSAKKIDTDTWVYYVDTKNLPNGMYAFVANIKNRYGVYEEKTSFVEVKNSVEQIYTQIEQEQVQKLEMIATEIANTTEKETVAVSDLAVTTISSVPQVDPESALAIKTEGEIEQDTFLSLKGKVDVALRNLGVAMRTGNKSAIEEIQTHLQKLKSNFGAVEADSVEIDRLTKKIELYITQARASVDQKIAASNKLIEERTSEKAHEDSDFDGIANYDEVALFKTNPFVADTDGDGFADGAEVLGGYNPTNPKSEAFVSYENPKDNGVVREDILKVNSVTTASILEPEAQSQNPVAIISGNAMPNSYVTLYIFSEPVIVTVKTQSDGSWSYRFDKELEDGEHQIYIGVTDNAGKIVAKSTPFSFIKEAEAFSAVTQAQLPALPDTTTSETQTFFSQYMMYLVLSISVVAIGLVLILLGIHLNSRPPTEDIEEKIA